MPKSLLSAIFPLLAAAAMAPLPAHAADLGTINCVADRIELPVRAQIEIDVERNLTVADGRPTYDPRVTNALRIAAERCATDRGWPIAAQRPAILYTLATIGLPKARAIVTDRGFDIYALEQLWLALPEDQRNHPLSPLDYQGLIRTAITDEAQQTRENAELIKQFFGLLSVMQYSTYEFSEA